MVRRPKLPLNFMAITRPQIEATEGSAALPLYDLWLFVRPLILLLVVLALVHLLGELGCLPLRELGLAPGAEKCQLLERGEKFARERLWPLGWLIEKFDARFLLGPGNRYWPAVLFADFAWPLPLLGISILLRALFYRRHLTRRSRWRASVDLAFKGTLFVAFAASIGIILIFLVSSAARLAAGAILRLPMPWPELKSLSDPVRRQAGEPFVVVLQSWRDAVLAIIAFHALYSLWFRVYKRANGFSWLDVEGWMAALPHWWYAVFRKRAVNERRLKHLARLLNRERELSEWKRYKHHQEVDAKLIDEITRQGLVRIAPAPGQKGVCFLIIGDPGEGDASQTELLRQVEAFKESEDPAQRQRGKMAQMVGKAEAARPIDFAVIASDVVYPTGQLRDYEMNFFRPFSGYRSPIYAIPGNHDWYSGLRGFAAVFLRRSFSISGRWMLGEVDRLIKATGVDPGGHASGRPQKFSFFELAFDAIPLTVFALDTGCVGQVDPVQEAWLRRRLAELRSEGRPQIIMALLGVPVYVNGRCQSSRELRRVYRVLRQHRVDVIMAGNTHNYQPYIARIKFPDRNEPHIIHHIVNGGGGAFINSTTFFGRQTFREPGAIYDEANEEDIIEESARLVRLYPSPGDMRAKFAGPVERLLLESDNTWGLDHDREPFFQSFVLAEAFFHGDKGTWMLRLTPYIGPVATASAVGRRMVPKPRWSVEVRAHA